MLAQIKVVVIIVKKVPIVVNIKPVFSVEYDFTDLSAPIPIGYKCRCLKSLNPNSNPVPKRIVILERRIRPRREEECPPGIPILVGPDPIHEIKSKANTENDDEKAPRKRRVHLKEDYNFDDHAYMYYVHYNEWDRRMDEWVVRKRLLLNHESDV